VLVAEQGYIYDLLIKLGLSDFGARTGEFLLVRPLQILLILGAALLLARLAGRAIDRFIRSVQARSPIRLESARAEQRAATLAHVLGSLTRTVIMGVALLMVLGQLGLDLAPLIAGAGIAGVAIGFGAQSLVKDFLSGFFVIVEDQYGVGDSVDLGGTTGTVEELTMRVTRVRSVDGTVWFVPNGEIRKVGNTSMEWARAVVDVLLDYDNDIDAAAALMQEEAEAFADDPDRAEHVLDRPEVWGVHAMGPEGITVRLMLKTAPGQQHAMARALRARVHARLRQAGVNLPPAP
jgi:moderate conductance mechanosensitive channel